MLKVAVRVTRILSSIDLPNFAMTSADTVDQ